MDPLLELDLRGHERLDLVSAVPVHHALELLRLRRLGRHWRERAPKLELRLWLYSDHEDVALYEALPFDRIEVLGRDSALADAARRLDGVAVALLGTEAHAAILRRQPGIDLVTIAPPSFHLSDCPPGDHDDTDEDDAVRTFHRSLRDASPRWLTAAEAAWPIEIATPAPRWLVHQARFHVGDILWLTPLLRAIHRLVPGAVVTLVGPPVARRVLAGNPHVAEIVPYAEDDGTAERRRILQLLAERRFDAALFGFGRWPTSTWLAEACAEHRVPHRINLEYFDARYDPRTIAPWATHEAFFFWSTLASPAMMLRGLDPFFARDERPELDRRLDFHVSSRARQSAAAALAERGLVDEPFVVLTPGGYSSTRWPEHCFAELAARLAASVPVLLEGAPAEEDLLRRVADQARGLSTPTAAARIHVAVDPLDVFAAVLSSARLLVSNDSAPIHLAEVTGTPTFYFTQREKLVHSHPAGTAWALYDPIDNTVGRISVEQAWGAMMAMDGKHG